MRTLYWVNHKGLNRLSYTIYRGDLYNTADPSNTKWYEISDFLDEEAESANYHELVPAHRVLGAILTKLTNKEKATEIMLEIANLGGLQNLGSREVLKELGIPSGWSA